MIVRAAGSVLHLITQPDHAALLAEGNATGQRRCLEREDPHDARQSTMLGPPVAAARHLSS